MQAALDLQSESLTAWLNAPERPETLAAPQQLGGWYYPAPYGVYATRDGHIALSLASLKTLGAALEEPRLAAFSEQDAWARRAEIASLVASALRERTTAEWSARMEPLQIWHAPVQGYEEIVQDPQVQHNRCFVTVRGAGPNRVPVTLVNHPLTYDGEAAEVQLPPQPLGAHTAEVLAELGFGAVEAEALERDGVVRVAKRDS
jgi:crotonobetainyl-CoA:carnitine CoA-transferase CaiB-like acyl-CoA transferase